MGITFIIIGTVLMAIVIIKRWVRVAKGKDKIFGGYTLNEAIIQWVGVIIVIIGVIIIFTNN